VPDARMDDRAGRPDQPPTGALEGEANAPNPEKTHPNGYAFAYSIGTRVTASMLCRYRI